MTTSDNNPFAAPSYDGEVDARQHATIGIGRLPFFLLWIGIVIAFWALVIIPLIPGIAGTPDSMVFWFPMGVALLLIYAGVPWITVLRLNNMGYSGWWYLGYLVPLLNAVVQIGCFAAPEGFAHHKTLDTSGKVIVGIQVAFILSFLVAFIFRVIFIA